MVSVLAMSSLTETRALVFYSVARSFFNLAFPPYPFLFFFCFVQAARVDAIPFYSFSVV